MLYAGQSVFVIIPDMEKDTGLKQEVAQPNAKVVQPETETSLKYCLSALESKIKELIELNLKITSNQIANPGRTMGSTGFESVTFAV